MSEPRREWRAADTAEVLAMFPDEPHRDVDATRAARYFGCEVMQGIPEGPGYWALEPRCVVGVWYRRPHETRWECLRCYGLMAFSSNIERDFLARLTEWAKTEGSSEKVPT